MDQEQRLVKEDLIWGSRLLWCACARDENVHGLGRGRREGVCPAWYWCLLCVRGCGNALWDVCLCCPGCFMAPAPPHTFVCVCWCSREAYLCQAVGVRVPRGVFGLWPVMSQIPIQTTCGCTVPLTPDVFASTSSVSFIWCCGSVANPLSFYIYKNDRVERKAGTAGDALGTALPSPKDYCTITLHLIVPMFSKLH